MDGIVLGVAGDNEMGKLLAGVTVSPLTAKVLQHFPLGATVVMLLKIVDHMERV